MTRREAMIGMATLAVGREAMAQDDGKSLVEQLGHPKGTRLLMIHADDIGMCHSVNAASEKAMTEGVASAGSIMVPCPWFPEIAAWFREHPDADLGLHLTLTSEWRYYRWRPVSPVEHVKGLVDEEGFLWRRVEDVVAHSNAREVETEIRAQIARARQFGLKPTHVDSHMGTLFAKKEFFEAYVRVSQETGIMAMVPGLTPDIEEEAKALGIDYQAVTSQLRRGGHVILDRLSTGLSAKSYDARKKELLDFIRGLKPGVTELIVHLAMDDEEIRHVTGNWEARWHDFRLCTDPEVRAFLKEQKVGLVGYRELGKVWKAGQAPA